MKRLILLLLLAVMTAGYTAPIKAQEKIPMIIIYDTRIADPDVTYVSDQRYYIIPHIKTRGIVEWERLNDDWTSTGVTGSFPGSAIIRVQPGLYRVKIYSGPVYNLWDQINYAPVTNAADLANVITISPQGNRNALLRIEQWGNAIIDLRSSNEIQPSASYDTRVNFAECVNLDITATDLPNLKYQAYFTRMFKNCRSLKYANGRINDWDVSKIHGGYEMFMGCTSFNQKLDRWKLNSAQPNSNDPYITRVYGFVRFFEGSGIDCDNLTNTLIGWASNPNIASQYPSSTRRFKLGLGWKAYNRLAVNAVNTLVTKKWELQEVNYDPYCGYDAHYVSIWDSRIPNKSDANWFYINVLGANFSIEWERLNPDNHNDVWGSGTIDGIHSHEGSWYAFPAHAHGGPGVYRIRAYPGMGEIYGLHQSMEASNSDPLKLIRVEQWGKIPWRRLYWAFRGCRNLEWVTATDVPRLDGLTHNTSLGAMFAHCNKLRFSAPNLNSWNLSSVTHTDYMFYECHNLEIDVTNWATNNVTNMRAMFAETKKFNCNLAWHVYSVVNMEEMFQNAKAFNGWIRDWNVVAVQNMNNMFNGATAFNQPIWWGHSNALTSTWGMFANSNFNNQLDLKTNNVTTMGYMFWNNPQFNQNIRHFNVERVTDMEGIFGAATSYNHSLGEWNINALTNGKLMFAGSGMDCYQYSNTIMGWAANAATANNVTFTDQTGRVYNRSAFIARNTLISKGWNITGDTYSPHCGIDASGDFVTVWNSTEASLRTGNTNNTIALNIKGNDYMIDWVYLDPATGYNESSTRGVERVSSPNDNDPYILTVPLPGAYRIRVTDAHHGDVWGLYMNTDLIGGQYKYDNNKLTFVEHWGNNAWVHLYGAFRGAAKMDLTATDVPVMHPAIDNLWATFAHCHNLTNANGSIGRWNTSSIKYMQWTFGDCPKFNKPLTNWTTHNVEDMNAMFVHSTSFNQPLSHFNTSNVKNMAYMFANTPFNQNINNWNVGNVTTMQNMFHDNAVFNQDISNWDMRKVTTIYAMFANSVKFNQNLGNWKLEALTEAFRAFANAGLDCGNWSASLRGWAEYPGTKSGVNFPEQWVMIHNRTAFIARNTLISKGWNITGDTYSPHCGIDASGDFVTVWNSTEASNRTGNTNNTIALNIKGNDYMIDWVYLDPATGYGESSTRGVERVSSPNDNDPYILTVPLPGAYRIRVTDAHHGDVWGLFMNTDLIGGQYKYDNNKLSYVEHWGNNAWVHFYGAFRGAAKMDVTATDVPNLTGCNSLWATFAHCWNMENSNGSIGRWNTSSIKYMQWTLGDCPRFNKPLTNWTTHNVEDMDAMFFNSTSFNQPLSHFNTSKVKNMTYVFVNTPFNQNISNWDVSKVTNMGRMFLNATAFNQNLGSWNLNSLTTAQEMFANSGMDCSNYSNTIKGWALNSATASNVYFTDQTGRSYNRTARPSRDLLINTKGWNITGDLYDAPCGGSPHVWTGAVSDSYYDLGNWDGAASIPAPGSNIEFATPLNSDYANLAARDLVVSGNIVTNNITNQTPRSLVVPAGTSLTVNGAVAGADRLEDAYRIRIEASPTQPNGTLILAGQPQANPVYGTVQMVVKSGKLPSPASWVDNIPGSPTDGQTQRVNYTWQYFGIPFDNYLLNPDDLHGTYIREYSEPRNAPDNFYGKWIQLGGYSPTGAFKGYEISQERPHGSNPIYWIRGRLVHGDRTLTLTRKAAAVAGATGDNLHYGLGQNIFGNSYTAAIAIDSIVFPPEAEQTVYLYRTGSLADWGAATTATTEAAWTAGNYLAIPAKVSSVLNNGQIPSMQGFLLRFTDAQTIHNGADATVTIRYGTNRVIPNTKPQMAPAYSGASGSSGSSESDNSGNNGELSYMQVTLGSRTTTDNLWLFEQEGTSERFDNGWDGRKYFGTPASFIYVKSPDGELQVSTNSTLDGTLITHYANRDTAYTLTLTRHNMPSESNPLYLIDLVERTYTALTSDTTRYNFTVDSHNVAVKRFMLTSRKPGGEVIGSESDTELLDLYFTPDGEVVLNNFTKEEGTATLYDVSGRVAGRYSAPVGTTRISLRHLPAGVYFATVEASTQRKTEKGIISIGQ